MASVYLAIQKSLERQVALKLMAASLVADESFRERFLKEGKIVGQLSHPHIITIYDIGVHQTCYYMAMEYVSGGTLKERILAGLAVEQAVEILRQIGEALGYAHKRGFVHRDVKPANILFRENGSAVLSDFGIAKAFADGTQMTGTGWTVGTPNYMSPEQALGKTVDARSDLYSLGIVFYEMLTGEKPYQSQDPFATALMHVNSPVPRLPPTLARFQEIIDRLLAKEPKDRYPSAEALIAAIDKVYGTGSHPSMAEDVTRLVVPVNTQATKPGGRWRLVWVLGLGLGIPATGVIVYLLVPGQSQPEKLAHPATPSTARTPSIPAGITPAIRPALDERTREQIKMLLEVAASHQEVGYLTDPPGSNALEIYRRVLELDPDNSEAQAGLQTIADLCGARARAGEEACPGFESQSR